MNEFNTRLLFERYPRLYQGHHLPSDQNLMSLGFGCGDGWFELLDQLSAAIEVECQKLRQAGWTDDQLPIALQVKEKFGLLCFRILGCEPVPRIKVLIEEARIDSECICDISGRHKSRQRLGRREFALTQGDVNESWFGEGAAIAKPANHEQLLDAVYLDATYRQVREALREAEFGISSLREEIAWLPDRSELAPGYRNAYGRLVSLLATVEKVIKDHNLYGIHGELMDLIYPEQHIQLGQDNGRGSFDLVLVAPARSVVEQINAAELYLLSVIDSAHKALLAQADRQVIDWSSDNFDLQLSVFLDAGPTRRFYEGRTDDDEPLRIPVPGYNWNIFPGNYSIDWKTFDEDGHPLRDVKCGFLVHSIIAHGPVRWELLPSIRDIEVTFRFQDRKGVDIRRERSISG